LAHLENLNTRMTECFRDLEMAWTRFISTPPFEI
jgi:hypothetical protein